MRVAYLDPRAVPDVGPEALQILYTADALGQTGADVVLVTPRPRGAITARAILGREPSARMRLRHLADPRRRWWFPAGSNRLFTWRAARVLRGLRADAVLTRHLKTAEYLLRHAPAVPLIFETHELFAQSYREEHAQRSGRAGRKLRALAAREGFVYRHARGLIALTPLLLADIRDAYGATAPAIVAPDGVDLDQARPPAATVRNEVPVLLYLGSLHPWKGVDVLIRALPHVRQAAVLHIVGGNASRIEELRHLARTQGVEQRVVFAGPVAPGSRFEWIHRADICLLPLTQTSIGGRYTSPLKLFEYMACAKPIVVSDLPSMRAVLHAGEDALLAPPGDPLGFAARIDHLLADADLRRDLGQRAAARAADFSWAQRARQIQGFVGRILDDASG